MEPPREPPVELSREPLMDSPVDFQWDCPVDFRPGAASSPAGSPTGGPASAARARRPGLRFRPAPGATPTVRPRPLAAPGSDR